MVNPQKRKGTDFERKIVKLLNEKIKSGKFKRVAGSGAIGTSMQEPGLTGDIKGEVRGFHKNFKGEAKVGYGGSTQLTIKKEWLDKIAEQADATYDFPFLVCRFSNSRNGVENFVVLDFEVFVEILNLVTELYDEVIDGLDKASGS